MHSRRVEQPAEFRNDFPVLETVCENAESEYLRPGDGLFARLPVGQDPREASDLSDPSPVFLTLDLDR